MNVLRVSCIISLLRLSNLRLWFMARARSRFVFVARIKLLQMIFFFFRLHKANIYYEISLFSNSFFNWRKKRKKQKRKEKKSSSSCILWVRVLFGVRCMLNKETNELIAMMYTKVKYLIWNPLEFIFEFEKKKKIIFQPHTILFIHSFSINFKFKTEWIGVRWALH